MTIPFVGAEPPEDARLADDAFVLFEKAPSKDDKAAIKRSTKWKLAFHKRAARATVKHAAAAELQQFVDAAAEVVPVTLVHRGIQSVHRERSRAHVHALHTAQTALEELSPFVEAERSSISQALATGLLFELWVADPDRSLSDRQRALLAPEIERAADHREWVFTSVLLNEREQLMPQLPTLTWDGNDALTFLHELVDRVSSWNEEVDGVILDVALALAPRLLPELPTHDRSDHVVADILWLAFRAALKSDGPLADQLEPLVRAHGHAARPSLVFGDLRRGGDDARYVAVADEVVDATATRLYDAGCFMVSRSPELALDLFDRACRATDPPWQAANNGIAMLLTIHPDTVPTELLKLWRPRIAARNEAPARHNYACLLVRLGEQQLAREMLLEAIEGGADLDPIAGDAALLPLLDDARVIQALDARVEDAGERARYEAMRQLALGRNEEAMQSLIAAAKAGYDPNELKYGDEFEPLHDHPDMKKVRRPPKKKRAKTR